MGIIQTAANDNIPVKTQSANRRHRIAPWWDQECSKWVNRRKVAIGEFLNDPNVENFNKLQAIKMRIRKLFKRKNRFHSGHFASLLTEILLRLRSGEKPRYSQLDLKQDPTLRK